MGKRYRRYKKKQTVYIKPKPTAKKVVVVKGRTSDVVGVTQNAIKEPSFIEKISYKLRGGSKGYEEREKAKERKKLGEEAYYKAKEQEEINLAKYRATQEAKKERERYKYRPQKSGSAGGFVGFGNFMQDTLGGGSMGGYSGSPTKSYKPKKSKPFDYWGEQERLNKQYWGGGSTPKRKKRKRRKKKKGKSITINLG